MVIKYEIDAVRTPYWKPGEDFLQQVVDHVRGRVEDGDFLTISEKALSTALGNIVDESLVQPGWFARFLSKYWMRVFWGCFLGPLCHLRRRTIRYFRFYPIEAGGAHKQVVLRCAGFSQALLCGSEGGIDGSNLAYSYVSLPLKKAPVVARRIRDRVRSELGKNVAVMIVDTDKTYSFHGFHFTPRPKPVKGIHALGGFLAYVVGRFFKIERRATPIAVEPFKVGVEESLRIAEIANRARGFGAGRTVWEMADRLNVSLTGVTWEMLERLEHRPIVIVRKMKRTEAR